MKRLTVEERIEQVTKRHLAAKKAWRTIHANESRMSKKERDALRVWRGSLVKGKKAESKSKYDPDFDKEIRRLRPGWGKVSG